VVGLIYAQLFGPSLVLFLLGYAAHRALFRQPLGNVETGVAFGLTWLVAGAAAIALTPIPRDPPLLVAFYGAIALIAFLVIRICVQVRPLRDRASARRLPKADASIDARFFGMARAELLSSRNEDLWAKYLALADGDNSRAEAFYIASRATEIAKQAGDSANAVRSRSTASEHGPRNADVASAKPPVTTAADSPVPPSNDRPGAQRKSSAILLGLLGLFGLLTCVWAVAHFGDSTNSQTQTAVERHLTDRFLQLWLSARGEFDLEGPAPTVVWEKPSLHGATPTAIAATVCGSPAKVIFDPRSAADDPAYFDTVTMPHELAHVIICELAPELDDYSAYWAEIAPRFGLSPIHGAENEDRAGADVGDASVYVGDEHSEALWVDAETHWAASRWLPAAEKYRAFADYMIAKGFSADPDSNIAVALHNEAMALANAGSYRRAYESLVQLQCEFPDYGPRSLLEEDLRRLAQDVASEDPLTHLPSSACELDSTRP